MASTIKVDNVQNQPGTNIINKCGTTITLGASSDTIALASGASQTGFGRTGTVDWDTSIHTGTVTAATGKGYFVNTTSGEITVNLPAAAVGSIVAVSDYASTSDSNNILVAPNGTDKINAVNESFAIQTAGLAVTLVYADATRGWKSVTGSDADSTGLAAAYVAASGGNTTITCGDYKVHVFTGPGTLCVSNAGNPKGSGVVDYLVVAGGGGGGKSSANPVPAGDSAGGGGAGGMRYSISTVPAGHPIASPTGIAVPVAPYAVVVGGGGAGSTSTTTRGCAGNVSSFHTISSAGGGSGGGGCSTPLAGGSGGGMAGGGGKPAAGVGNSPPTSPAQGFPGGNNADSGPYSPDRAGGAGGGAATIGGSVTGGGNTGNATGGNGAYVPGPWFGPTSPTYGQSPTPLAPNGRYFGGGGAGASPGSCGPPEGGGDAAGGGGGFSISICCSGPGDVNTGGGGAGGPARTHGAGGGSGIVIIRYKFQ